MEYVLAPRAYWKGYLKLSLVSCPVALFPASSEREKISFSQLSARQPRVAASNGSIAEGADQTRRRNREAVRDDRWNAVPISNYRRLDE